MSNYYEYYALFKQRQYSVQKRSNSIMVLFISKTIMIKVIKHKIIYLFIFTLKKLVLSFN